MVIMKPLLSPDTAITGVSSCDFQLDGHIAVRDKNLLNMGDYVALNIGVLGSAQKFAELLTEGFDVVRGNFEFCGRAGSDCAGNGSLFTLKLF